MARRPGLWQLSRHFGQSPGPPSPWLHSELSPPATLGCLFTQADPSGLPLGRWGGGQGPQAPASQAIRPPQPSPPSQQRRAMGRPTGPAPAGTAAEAGLTPALTARIPSESGVLGGACGRPGPERGSAVHRGVSGPSLCPPQALAGRSSLWPLWPRPSWPPVSSASSAGAAADAHPGGSPGTRRPWAWPGSAAPPPHARPGPGSGRPGEVRGERSPRTGWSAQKRGPAGLPGRGPTSRVGGSHDRAGPRGRAAHCGVPPQVLGGPHCQMWVGGRSTGPGGSQS